MTAALIAVVSVLGALLLLAVAAVVCSRIYDRQITDALEDLNADEFIADLRCLPPAAVVRHYSAIADPLALRALAAEVAEDAARLEARRVARIEPGRAS